jgi:hypothetical protein
VLAVARLGARVLVPDSDGMQPDLSLSIVRGCLLMSAGMGVAINKAIGAAAFGALFVVSIYEGSRPNYLDIGSVGAPHREAAEAEQRHGSPMAAAS